MNAVVQLDEPRAVVATENEAGSMMHAIIAAATDPRTDVAKMERMLEVAKELRAEQARAAYASALAKFTSLKHTIATNRTGEAPGGAKFQYSDWPQMERAIRPWLSACGLSLTHRQDAPVMDGKHIALIMVHAILSHSDGHSESVSYPAMPNPKVAERLSPSQAIQQGITYAKRQTAAMILGLATAEDKNDDDGQKDIGLTAAQRSTLADLMAAWEPTDAQKTAFYTWLGVDDVEAMNPKAYPNVVNVLKKKIAEKSQA